MEQALPKVLGILGGLGPMATVYFYEMLTRHTQAARDQDHIDVIINSRATTPDRTSYILGQSAENPFDIMAADAARLVTFGADVIAMGSDFDGSDMPHGITGLESVEDIANVFLRHNLPEALVDKIFFENAASFFKRFDRNA